MERAPANPNRPDSNLSRRYAAINSTLTKINTKINITKRKLQK
jgi:hypothetical protein